MSRWRRTRLGAGALMIAVPSCAAAVAANRALATPAQQPPQINPRPVRVPYGRELAVHGTAPAADAGHVVVLEFASRGQSAWRRLSSSTIGADGRFRLAGSIVRSGVVRALDTTSGSVTPLLAGIGTGRSAPTSAPLPVEVAARVRVRSRQIAVLGGQAIRVGAGCSRARPAGRSGSRPGRAGAGTRCPAPGPVARGASCSVTSPAAPVSRRSGSPLRATASTAGRPRPRAR